MRADAAEATRRRDARSILLFALAGAGGFIAFVPLLTLLLPARMALAAGDARIEWLGAATFAGAISASLSNIAFGWASDVRGSRRGWVAAGLVLTVASYGLIGAARTPAALVGAVVAYQAALNMMLAPLAAWTAETVPDERKGVLGGLLGAGPVAGAMAGVVVTMPALPGAGARLATVCVLVAALVLPLLLAGPPGVSPQDRAVPATGVRARGRARKADLVRLWLARLLVQVAGSVLFAFLLYALQSRPGEGWGEADVAWLSAAALLSAVPLALLLGRASDRAARRRPYLVGTALAASAGLLVMALAADDAATMAGYVLFECGSTIFLALHGVTAMQWLPSSGRRGRDLGLFNLTNTLPALVSPVIAAGLAPTYGFGTLLGALAALTLAAALLVLRTREDNVLERGDDHRHNQR